MLKLLMLLLFMPTLLFSQRRKDRIAPAVGTQVTFVPAKDSTPILANISKVYTGSAVDLVLQDSAGTVKIRVYHRNRVRRSEFDDPYWQFRDQANIDNEIKEGHIDRPKQQPE